jgi:hypothetical protein
LADAVEVFVVADDVVVVVALPDGKAGSVTQQVDPAGGGGFEPGDDRT